MEFLNVIEHEYKIIAKIVQKLLEKIYLVT